MQAVITPSMVSAAYMQEYAQPTPHSGPRLLHHIVANTQRYVGARKPTTTVYMSAREARSAATYRGVTSIACCDASVIDTWNETCSVSGWDPSHSFRKLHAAIHREAPTTHLCKPIPYFL